MLPEVKLILFVLFGTYAANFPINAQFFIPNRMYCTVNNIGIALLLQLYIRPILNTQHSEFPFFTASRKIGNKDLYSF